MVKAADVFETTQVQINEPILTSHERIVYAFIDKVSTPPSPFRISPLLSLTYLKISNKQTLSWALSNAI